MTSNVKTVAEYLKSLPPERRATISAVRDVVLANLPAGYEERMQYGMVSYVVPHSLYPAGYHCNPKDPLPYAMLASQKNHLALYLMTVYGDSPTAEWFKAAYAAAGKRLDMGKSCVIFRKLEDLPLEVIGQVIARVPVDNYIARVEQQLAAAAPAKRKTAGKPRRTGKVAAC